MMFKNSTKLFIANFSIFWKLILYYILVCGITIGLIAPFFGVLSTHFSQGGNIYDIASLLTSFNVSINPFSMILELNNVALVFVDLILSFFVLYPGIATYLFAVVFFVFPFLLGLADLPVGNSLFGYMSSLTRYSFVGSYLRLFGRSVRFQLFKTLINLPINLAIIITFIFSLRLSAVGGLMVYFLPFIIIAILVVLISLKKTVFAGVMPAKVVYDCNMFKAYRKGFKAIFRRFFKVFSNALAITVIFALITYLFGTFAFPVLIPFFASFFYVFEMIVFYGSQGMRYYVDLDTIVSPKRLEENDTFKKVKNII